MLYSLCIPFLPSALIHDLALSNGWAEWIWSLCKQIRFFTDLSQRHYIQQWLMSESACYFVSPFFMVVITVSPPLIQKVIRAFSHFLKETFFRNTSFKIFSYNWYLHFECMKKLWILKRQYYPLHYKHITLLEFSSKNWNVFCIAWQVSSSVRLKAIK